jgi:Tfp pilus assembly PilM family ATPase
MNHLAPLPRRMRRIGRVLSSLRTGRQLGLVITDKSVRICLVKQVLHRRRIVDMSTLQFDPQNTASWPRRIDAAIAAIKDYFGERKLSRIPVNVSLVGDDIAFRRMYLPRMPRKELAAAILWEGQKLFPFDFGQCFLHHEIADAGDQSKYEQIGVNLVAVKRDVIEILYDKMRVAGFPVGHVDFLPAVVTQAFPLSESKNDGTCRLLLLLDDDQSLAIFVRRGRLEFFQQFVTSVVPDGGGRMMNTAAMAAELTTFLDLFNGQQFGNAVDEIVMAGKYAADPDVADVFTGNTGLPCRRLSECPVLRSSLHPVKGTRGEAMLDVVATALADISRHPLIPDTARQKIERKKTILRLATATVFALVIIGNFHAQSLLLNHRLRMELDSARSASQTYENSPAYQAYLSLMSELSRRQTIRAHSQSRQSSHFHLLMKELSRTIPRDISLTSVEYSDEKSQGVLRLEGIVSLSGFSPEIVLAQYIEALNKSPFFENVTVKRHLKKNDNGRFDLSFMLEMGARV